MQELFSESVPGPYRENYTNKTVSLSSVMIKALTLCASAEDQKSPVLASNQD